MTSLQPLIDSLQQSHGDDAARDAAALRSACAQLPGQPGDAAALARLAEHLLIAHQADAAGLRRVLRECFEPLAPGDDTLPAALARGRFAAALLDDAQAPPPDGLPAPDQVRAMSNAAAGSGRGARWTALQVLVRRAAALAEGDDVSGRAYAAMANNLAADLRLLLLARPQAAAPLRQAMLDAAERARAAWSRVGGWVEAERAEYQLALCHAAAGDGEQAVRHARACLQGCVEHGADAFERFFAHEALVHAHVANREGTPAHDALLAMRECLAQVEDAESRAWGEKTLQDAERLLAA